MNSCLRESCQAEGICGRVVRLKESVKSPMWLCNDGTVIMVYVDGRDNQALETIKTIKYLSNIKSSNQKIITWFLRRKSEN